MVFSSLDKKISTLIQLGNVFRAIGNNLKWPGYSLGINELEYASFGDLIPSVKSHNGWFTMDAIMYCLNGWANLFTKEKLDLWVANYSFDEKNEAKTVALICAGNIPMVGFHDLICGYLAGKKLLVKLSSEDNVLIPAVVDLMSKYDENVHSQIFFEKNKLKKFDAVVATGSNNTSRYFKGYFGKYPHIIRKSRTSIAVLDGSESEKDLEDFSEDVFTYYGLGCRNVTKVYLPKGFDINRIFKGFFKKSDIIQNNKYANNYDYHKAIFLLENYSLLENGFILLKEDKSIFSPIGTLYYEFYNNLKNLEDLIDQNRDQIQCRVGINGIPFGKAQKPELWDYADEVDTMKFLSSI